MQAPTRSCVLRDGLLRVRECIPTTPVIDRHPAKAGAYVTAARAGQDGQVLASLLKSSTWGGNGSRPSPGRQLRPEFLHTLFRRNDDKERLSVRVCHEINAQFGG